MYTRYPCLQFQCSATLERHSTAGNVHQVPMSSTPVCCHSGWHSTVTVKILTSLHSRTWCPHAGSDTRRSACPTLFQTHQRSKRSSWREDFQAPQSSWTQKQDDSLRHHFMLYLKYSSKDKQSTNKTINITMPLYSGRSLNEQCFQNSPSTTADQQQPSVVHRRDSSATRVCPSAFLVVTKCVQSAAIVLQWT